MYERMGRVLKIGINGILREPDGDVDDRWTGRSHEAACTGEHE
jgi:hypothetical protein